MTSSQEQNEHDRALISALSKISAGKEKVEKDTERDEKDKNEVAQIEKDAKKAAIENDWLLIGLRKTYGYNLIAFMWVYFVVTFGLIIFNGFHVYGLNLSNKVLTAAIGGTAVSVLGVVGTIASGLFKPPEKK